MCVCVVYVMYPYDKALLLIYVMYVTWLDIDIALLKDSIILISIFIPLLDNKKPTINFSLPQMLVHLQ